MSDAIVYYDGSITASPRQLVYPETVEDIQSVPRATPRVIQHVFRPWEATHSLTPRASSSGTILKTSRMNRIIDIDESNKTLIAQAGLEYTDASKALREHNLQFMVNIETGNKTLGSAACATPRRSDGIEFGQSVLTRLGSRGSHRTVSSKPPPTPTQSWCIWSGQAR